MSNKFFNALEKNRIQNEINTKINTFFIVESPMIRFFKINWRDKTLYDQTYYSLSKDYENRLVLFLGATNYGKKKNFFSIDSSVYYDFKFLLPNGHVGILYLSGKTVKYCFEDTENSLLHLFKILGLSQVYNEKN